MSELQGKSLSDLKQTNVEEVKQAPEEVQIAQEKRAEMLAKAGLSEDPLQAALRREKEEEEAAEKAQADFEAKEKQEMGIEHEFKVAGMNIGDAIYRRKAAMDEQVRQAQAKLKEEEEKVETVATTETVTVQSSTETKEDEDEDINMDFTMGESKEESKTGTKSETKKDENDVSNVTVGDFAIDMNDFVLELGEDEVAAAPEEDDNLTDEQKKEIEDYNNKQQENFSKKVKETLAPKINNDGIKLTNKVIAFNDVLKAMNEKQLKSADWPLFHSGKLISVTPLTADEIDSLNRGSDDRKARFNILKEIYFLLYSKIVSEKPSSYEAWLKSTPFADIEHLYMAYYKACFVGANYIPYAHDVLDEKGERTGKTHIFLSDNIDIDSMVKIDDEKAKKRWNAIMSSDIAVGKDVGTYVTEIKPISDVIGISFRQPSIYNTIFENASLPPKVVTKYQRMLTNLVYIDKIYYNLGGEYYEVEYDRDTKSVSKDTKNRVIAYANILSKLDSDALNQLKLNIADISTQQQLVIYQVPEIECQEEGCDFKFEAQEQSPSSLLFTRHRLNLYSHE